jgi:hypothetical protein
MTFTGAEQMLTFILLEKAALLRWLQELELREAMIRKWVAQDASPTAADGSDKR